MQFTVLDYVQSPLTYGVDLRHNALAKDQSFHICTKSLYIYPLSELVQLILMSEENLYEPVLHIHADKSTFDIYSIHPLSL